MADQTQLAWTASPTALTVTALNTLADGTIWNSGVVASSSPTDMVIQITYSIELAAGGPGDYLAFWIIGNDDDGTTPYWPGSISESAGAITTAALVAAALAAVGQPHHIHAWQTSHGTTYRGTFFSYNFTPDWQLLIQVVSNAVAGSGNTVRYRYATPQIVSV